MFWPHLKRVGHFYPAHLAAEMLGRMRHKSIIFRRFEPTNYHKGGTEKPKMRYYMTDFGYGVYDYWARQRRE